MQGVVSTALAHEIQGELRRQGIVVWLDRDASYAEFVDGLAAEHGAGRFPFPVVGFRGSFLELLFALQPYGGGLEKQPLLIHMPGFHEETIRQTPVLELYEAGVRFRKSLDTLIREAATARVAPAEVEAFVATKPSLAEADAWLAQAVSQNAVGLAQLLIELGPKLLVTALSAEAPAADTRERSAKASDGRKSPLHQRVRSPEDAATLQNYLHRLTGFDPSLIPQDPPNPREPAIRRILRDLATWLLRVEYVFDLRRPPHMDALGRLRSLSPPLLDACREILAGLRREGPDAYERFADDAGCELADEFAQMAPEDLGQVDTFREEENRVLKGAVEALTREDWETARSFAAPRVEALARDDRDATRGVAEARSDRSFWLQRDPLRRLVWRLVGEAAGFGAMLAQHPRPFAGSSSLGAATERYAQGVYAVDRAHRRFEQLRLNLLDPRMPHHGLLLDVFLRLRQLHRAWADRLAADFTALCREHGFLPAPGLQQRTLFDQVVHPLVQTGEKVALFLIDAFRFELATELVDELKKGSGTVVDLKPRLCELPSLTAVGMNVLAPVASDGRLSVAGVFKGFRTGEYTVQSPADRARSIGMRSAGRPAPILKLAEVCEAHSSDLSRSVQKHSLLIVHSQEIDDAGEANVGLPTFESTLQQIRAAWHRLQAAGVKQFVFTADHGFLLQDETTQICPFGTARDPQRRHILDEYPRAEPGMVHVATAALGYDGLPAGAKYLLFREDTAVFRTGNPGATFVHGGNSPQERIIPVLTITRKRSESPGYSEYAVEVQPLPDVLGLHRLQVRVGFARQSTTSLAFAAPPSLDLTLRARDRDAVHVLIKEISGPGTLRQGRLQLPISEAWTEVFFSLSGPSDDRVRIEVYHADQLEKVQASTPEQWFSVSGSGGGMPAASASAATAASATAPGSGGPAKSTAGKGPAAPSSEPASTLWSDAIADAGLRSVFVHIGKHGVITETEVTRLLGSPRAFRRFSIEWEEHRAKLPFKVRIESNDSGKRYVKEES